MSSEHLLVLVVRHVSELIDTERVAGIILLVVGVVGVVVLLEDG